MNLTNIDHWLLPIYYGFLGILLLFLVLRGISLFHSQQIPKDSEMQKFPYSVLSNWYFLRYFLYCCIAILLYFAIENNSSKPVSIQDSQSGIDIYFLVDTSLSMNASSEFGNSRIEFLKSFLINLSEKLSGNRLSMITFAGSAFLYCPLTSDTATFVDYVKGIDIDMIGSRGSNLASAFQKYETLRKTKKVFRSSLIILLTDGGEKKLPSFPLSHNESFIVLGIGSVAKTPIRFENKTGDQQSGFVTKKGTLADSELDPDIILSARNDDVLSELAKNSGGVYLIPESDSLVESEILQQANRMEKTTFQAGPRILEKDLTYEKLFPAVLLLLLDLLLQFFYTKSNLRPGGVLDRKGL